MRVGIVSDTHYPERARGLEEVRRELSRFGPELILHAGDLTSSRAVDELEAIAPLEAVEGNMDPASLKLPVRRVLEIEGKKILLHHGRGIYPRGNADQLAYLARENQAIAVVTGHTHRPMYTEVGEVEIINPGSPTVPRMSPRTLMVGEVGEKTDVNIVKL